ncbi:hypothetical protein D3C76_1317020 [compost metagenome]
MLPLDNGGIKERFGELGLSQGISTCLGGDIYQQDRCEGRFPVAELTIKRTIRPVSVFD